MKKEVNPFKRGNLANCLAFHDFDIKKIKLNDFFKYIVNLFHEYGLQPTRMNLTSPTNQSISMKTFMREHKKLQAIPENEIEGFTLQATSYNSDDSWGDNLFDASLSKRNSGKIVFVFDSQFFTFDIIKTKEILQQIIFFLSPNYGYFYQREFKKGPELYPGGVLCGISSLKGMRDYSPEAELITRWGNKLISESSPYKTGDLRDVYLINLLVNAHLTREVLPNTTFEQFIDSDKQHGTLEKIADNHYAWVIDEENIPIVREALRPSGMIIAG